MCRLKKSKNGKHIEKSDLRRRSNISYWYSRSRERDWKKKKSKRKSPKVKFPKLLKNIKEGKYSENHTQAYYIYFFKGIKDYEKVLEQQIKNVFKLQKESNCQLMLSFPAIFHN